MPNSDTILCVITCRFTRKIVQILEQCSGLKGDCKNSMLIFTSNQQSPHQELYAAATWPARLDMEVFSRPIA